ncbi:carbohydrate ABC transporter permease [Bradyrhizobium jicamae]|uniref:carbohydrate ABC transporter permease n=1 Tax=Bradyrhizobium jicamae TaxID=280332 RepID=UPI001BA7CC5A|nr:sugar ABC transporter permease [Bradyrhizobium jicamae]MBR0939062.1 sugar ABC transporter permease [Bradyrhizobium jicamae]
MTSSISLDSAKPARGHAIARVLENRLPYLIIAPAILILLLVGLFPLIYSLVVSFQHVTMTENDRSFVGLMNYAELFRDARLWEALGHTAIITVIALPLELLIGFLMAQLFIDRMLGRQVFVALLVLPTVISPIVAGATWRLMFDVRFGPVGEILSFFAGEPVRILWTVNPSFVYPAIIICEVWQWSPFMFLLLLAALSNVDQSQLEAAELDGASYFRVLRAIVLPSIAPVIAVACLIRGLDLVRIFDIIWALTEGGPGSMTETISLYTYVQGFSQFETSYTAAIAFLVIALLTVITTVVLKRMELAR